MCRWHSRRDKTFHKFIICNMIVLGQNYSAILIVALKCLRGLPCSMICARS